MLLLVLFRLTTKISLKVVPVENNYKNVYDSLVINFNNKSSQIVGLRLPMNHIIFQRMNTDQISVFVCSMTTWYQKRNSQYVLGVNWCVVLQHFNSFRSLAPERGSKGLALSSMVIPRIMGVGEDGIL